MGDALFWIVWFLIMGSVWVKVIREGLGDQGKAWREKRRTWVAFMQEQAKQAPEISRMLSWQVWAPRIFGLVCLGFSVASAIWAGVINQNVVGAVYSLSMLIVPIWLVLNGYYSIP